MSYQNIIDACLKFYYFITYFVYSLLGARVQKNLQTVYEIKPYLIDNERVIYSGAAYNNANIFYLLKTPEDDKLP